MKLSILASGSGGNAAFISSGSTRLIVDVGISVKALRQRLAVIGERFEDISAFCITHAHGDHVGSLGRAMREGIRRGRAIPAYMTRATEEVINWGGLESPPCQFFDAGKSFVIGDIQVQSFTIPHDCSDPVAFSFTDGKSKIGIATDLGFIPPALVARFRDCDAVMIESNYDPAMLAACDRPDLIKDRISCRMGHLSNGDTIEYLRKGLGPKARNVILGHLSQETNSSELVYRGAVEALRSDFRNPPALWIARQDEPTQLFEV